MGGCNFDFRTSIHQVALKLTISVLDCHHLTLSLALMLIFLFLLCLALVCVDQEGTISPFNVVKHMVMCIFMLLVSPFLGIKENWWTIDIASTITLDQWFVVSVLAALSILK
jgi:hypothetical protein